MIYVSIFWTYVPAFSTVADMFWKVYGIDKDLRINGNYLCPKSNYFVTYKDL